MNSKLHASKQTLLQNLFDYERKETVGEIVFYRFFELFVIYWALLYAWEWGPYLSRLKDVVLPLGIAEYLDISFMFEHNLGVAGAIVMTVLLAAGFLRLWRYAYLVSIFTFHLLYVARYSQGKVAHGPSLIGLAILFFAVATLAFEHRKEIRRTALGLCYFFFGVGYTSAALCKLGATGPTWPAGRHLWMWIQERTVDTFSLTGTVDYNALQQLALDHGLLATAILTFGLLIEMCACLMWFKRFRPVIMPLLVGMHLGITMVMKISFTANVSLLVLLAFTWAALIDYGLRRLDAGTFDMIKKRSLRWA